MNPLLSPDAPTERGADYSEAFSGIDAIEGQGLENPMGSAPVAPAAPTPAPAPAPEVAPVAAAPTAPAEAPKPKVEDLFNLDRFTPKKDEPTPAAKIEQAKPEPTSIKQFREQYEMTKKERDDFAAKVSELERAKSEGTRKEVEEATKALKAEMDSIRKNAEELDTEVRYLNYTRSTEYKQKYESPLREAWQTALGDIEGIRVTDEDGTERDANHQDIMVLLNVPVAKAAIIAQETFGPAAPEIMAHRRRLIELTQARDKSIAEWKEKGAQREIEKSKQVETRQSRSRELFESQFADYEKTHAQLFGKEEGDEDGNRLLDESDRLIKIALKGEGVDADMGYDDKVDLITKAQAQVALRARAYGRERLRVIRLQQKVAELEKKVGKVRSSEPGQGEGTSTATRVAPRNAEDGIDELPSAY
jgi:BMFP domain-containing protein YqiC